MQAQSKHLKWIPTTEKSFIDLKNAFATPLVLQQPHPYHPSIMEVDATDAGVGAIPSQWTVFFSGDLQTRREEYEGGGAAPEASNSQEPSPSTLLLHWSCLLGPGSEQSNLVIKSGSLLKMAV